MTRWLTNNLGLKLLALALALALWFYVQGELARMERVSPGSTVEYEPLDLVAVPIRAHLTGRPPRGYRIDPAKVVVEPSSLVIAGRSQWLGHLHVLWTEPIDVSGVRETLVRKVRVVGLRAPALHTEGAAATVTVTVPVDRW